MDTSKLLRRSRLSSIVYISIFALILLLRVEPVNLVFASHSFANRDSGTVTATVDTGAPPPCDPQDPNCGFSPCDPNDPACPDNGGNGGGGGPPPCDPQNGPCSPFPANSEIGNCDGIDNDGNGIVDDNCDNPGGPQLTTFPGGAAGSLLINGPSSIVDPSLLSGSPGVDITPGRAEGTLLSKEVICNDGIDNDHNARKDSNDPNCALAMVSEIALKPTLPVTGSNVAGNGTKILGLVKSPVSGSGSDLQAKEQSASQDNSSSGDGLVINIVGEGKHDIRTISLHYKYSENKITIGKGTKISWVNNDMSEPHGINLIDKATGNVVFSYPVIRPGNFAYYIFDNPGQYIYTDPKYPSLSGLLTVLG